LASGKILSINDDGSTQEMPDGSWTQSGNNVTFTSRDYAYTLSVSGDRMTGEGTYHETQFKYNLTRVRD
jgi:hypothetical protein